MDSVETRLAALEQREADREERLEAMERELEWYRLMLRTAGAQLVRGVDAARRPARPPRRTR